MNNTQDNPSNNTIDDSQMDKSFNFDLTAQEQEEFNLIKDQLEYYPWEQIKHDRNILEKTVQKTGKFDPASMIESENTYLLSKIFTNAEKIPQQLRVKVLEIFINFDLTVDTEIQVFQNVINNLLPGLEINKKINLAELKPQAEKIFNGQMNVRKIVCLNEAKEIMTYVAVYKKFPAEQIKELTKGLQEMNRKLIYKINSRQEISQAEINQVVDFLEKMGHTKLQMEKFRDQANFSNLAEIMTSAKEAIEVVDAAYTLKLVDKLNDKEVVADLIEKTQIFY